MSSSAVRATITGRWPAFLGTGFVVATVAAGLLAAGSPAAEAALPRSSIDRSDDRAGAQVHFLYVVPRDGEDRALDTSSVISASVASWQNWLRRETGGRAMQVDTYQGDLDVSFFRLATDDAVAAARGAFVREQIEEEIFAAGFNSPAKLYAVYYDGSSTWSCGGGDPQPTFRGAVGAMYLRGTPPGAPPCASNPLGRTPPGYFEFGMLHEIMHTLGIVPRCAPHVTRVDHVSDSPFDLMWAGDAPWRTDAPEQMRLDVGRDDYYGHGRLDCPDFATSPYLGGREQVSLTVALAGRGGGNVEVAAGRTSSVLVCPPTCTGTFVRGEDVTLSAQPEDGSFFAGWEGACSEAVGPCTVHLDQAANVTARFDKQRYRVVVAVLGHGRVRFATTTCIRRCATNIEHATTLVLRATPRRGAKFLGWRGACRGTRPCRLVVVRPTTVTARFQG
jgi:hypothetical protein